MSRGRNLASLAAFPLTAAALNNAGLFGAANAVGTVSQSAGIPTGAVIESGSNANGSYVKYADGTMICDLSIVVTDQAMSDAYGSFYQGVRNWTFPAPFASGTLPSVACGAFRWGTGAGWSTVRAVDSNVSCTLRGFDIASRATGTATNISAIAKGRWF